jgi:hypothetical protein
MNRSLRRQEAVYQTFKREDPHEIARVIGDGYRRKKLPFLRWCGSGDLFPEAVQVLNILAKEYPDTVHKVVTRKPEMAALVAPLPNIFLMFSLDSSEESRQRKKIVDQLEHPRLYYSYLREEANEDTMGAAIIFNLQSKKHFLPYEDPKRVCPVDAGRLAVEGACAKCKRCASERVLQL